MNLDEIIAKLPDAQELDFGENGKMSVADLKAHLGALKNDLTVRDQRLAEREKQIAAYEPELQRLKKFEVDTSALFNAAAAATANPAEDAASPLASSVSGQTDYEKDEFFRPYTDYVLSKIQQNVIRPLIEKELAPAFQKQRNVSEGMLAMMLDRDQKQQFRDLGEWPEGWTLEKARQYGKEKGYLDPRLANYGVLDLGRIHNEVMGPVEREREAEKIRTQTRDETLRQLRMEGRVIDIPNRGGIRKQVQAKGSTADEIIGNSLAEAANDIETQRQLIALQNI